MVADTASITKMHGYHSAYTLNWQDLLSSEIAGCARFRRTGKTAVLLARAANGSPSRDGANKALDPDIAAADLLPFGSLTTSLTSKREAL
jgi:hypothetical protein